MKSILVPTSQESMSRLDFDNCIDGDLIDINISDDDFSAMMNLGLIELLNKSLDLYIDEFEDEEIVGSDELNHAKIIIENHFTIGKEKMVDIVLTQINKAIKYNTGIFFYF
ncbi:hypothetical protein DT73_04035 [Mangrovibacter sp. MFB070]|uniref:hypothetical protein n=1 Tax=Mangrovibacter sp. MFB070 TaxID=1224318 RepID=UPI0004D9A1D8|nr:hypothetical protein [Mangrovibacter sp. MFB070]KEA53971.1 hypothetical protein DT73_04035 [Mangrovibacter sp. MFB070]